MELLFVTVLNIFLISQVHAIPDISQCVRIDEVADKAACTMGKLMSYREADETCRANGMKLFSLNNSSMETAIFHFYKSVFRSELRMWIAKNGSEKHHCPIVTLEKDKVLRTDIQCGGKSLAICEMPETYYESKDCFDAEGQKAECERPSCGPMEEYYRSSTSIHSLCRGFLEKNYFEAYKNCKLLNLTLLVVKHEKAKAGLQDYMVKTYGVTEVYLFWIAGTRKNDGQWFTSKKTPLLKSMDTISKRPSYACLSLTMFFTKIRGDAFPCNKRHDFFCGKNVRINN